ncbi:response regulator [Fimbriimonas ginsengisoli]|uniref:Response regulator receiver protein n=1 Tax=Fimbriimonas ginsengisoli Gsoil 348 TaxID=661478 RepID=A0A068NSZ0_FIMGI|nr:response regulator [Fimbriimonas ginsengisoli]AIE85890.1 response regulator receiver protein [Fimbriimonas ginsengisoli Gsoil 348]
MTRKTILLVEDNEDDVFALRRSLKKAQVANPVQVAEDGQKALDYLAGVGPYADREQYPLPRLVLLDLKLPYRNGMEVLAWIRQQRSLDALPVVILSGSDEARDHKNAAALGIHDYLVKPPSPDRILQVIESLGIYQSVGAG